MNNEDEKLQALLRELGEIVLQALEDMRINRELYEIGAKRPDIATIALNVLIHYKERHLPKEKTRPSQARFTHEDARFLRSLKIRPD